jgi:hypothetical protein
MTLDEQITQKESELNELKNLKRALNIPLGLSAVYKESLVWGLAYEDGGGTIEMDEVVNNWPERLIDVALEQYKNPLHDVKRYIVGCRPETVWGSITPKGKIVSPYARRT